MNDVSPGKLTLLIGAGVTFIFSFLPWYSVSGFGSSFSRNAWGSGMFPMATWAPIFAVLVGFAAAAQAFKFLELPEKIWKFTLDQLVLVLSVFTLIITVSYLIMDKGGASIGFGLILCLLASIAMVVGFVMDDLGVGVDPNATAGGTDPQTGQAAQAQAQAGQAQAQQPAPGAPQPPAGQAPPAQPAPPQQPPAQQPPPQQPPQQQNPGSF